MLSFKKCIAKLNEPVCAGSLAAFRIFFGIIMTWEVFRYFDRGWIERYWINPEFNFKYELFEWVHPLPADGMFLLFYLLAILSVTISIGLFYRVSSTLFFLIFTYTFLLDQARYLNHFYLVILVSFLMTILPAHRGYSVDAWLFPKLRNAVVPFWSVCLIQFQIGIVYFFGGVAKMNADWLTGSPMDAWLPRRSDFPFVGEYFEIPGIVLFISYSGLLLDLLALPLLLYRKSRPYMAVALVLFHFTNDRLFTIGIFPWFMIAALTIFLPPSWPRDVWTYLSEKSLNNKLFCMAVGFTGAFTGAWFHEGYSTVPFFISFLITVVLVWDFHKNPAITEKFVTSPSENKPGICWVSGLSIWILFQLIIPMRHMVIPGNPSWTEEGVIGN